MRTVLIAALLFAAPAHASPEDDLVACMVGQAAAALRVSGSKEESLEIAYGGCGMEDASDAEQKTYAAVADYINLMVERMAGD